MVFPTLKTAGMALEPLQPAHARCPNFRLCTWSFMKEMCKRNQPGRAQRLGGETSNSHDAGAVFFGGGSNSYLRFSGLLCFNARTVPKRHLADFSLFFFFFRYLFPSNPFPPTSRDRLAQVFLMPEGYRHDIQHRNQPRGQKHQEVEGLNS